jgi:hypothetical protein
VLGDERGCSSDLLISSSVCGFVERCLAMEKESGLGGARGMGLYAQHIRRLCLFTQCKTDALVALYVSVAHRRVERLSGLPKPPLAVFFSLQLILLVKLKKKTYMVSGMAESCKYVELLTLLWFDL